MIHDLNNALKRYDKNLFARQENGIVRVYVKGKKAETCHIEGVYLTYPVNTEWLVLSLTHNWSYQGQRRNWGVDKVMFRIREIDAHKRDVIREMEEANEKAEKAKERDFQNHTESFLYEWRDDIKKSFNDVNTSLMDKSLDPERKKEKRSF